MTSDAWRLEQRLRRQLLLALTVLWLLGSALSLYAHWEETNEVLDAAQEEIAYTALRIPTPSNNARTLEALPHPHTAHDQALLIQVYTRQGSLIWRTPRAPDQPLAPLDQNITRDQGDWRLSVRPAPAVDRVVIVASSLHDRREAIRDNIRSSVVALLILLPLTALTVSWLLRRVFRRMDVLREDLKLRGPQQLSPLPTEGLPREFTPLVDTLNLLFEQLLQVRQAERAFAANSAHELRTPIAAAQAQLQRLAHEVHELPSTSTEQREALDQRIQAVTRQLQRLHHLCVKLLQLSRADAGVAQHTTPVNLVDLARLVLDEYRTHADGSRLSLACPQDKDPAVMAQGDLDTLGIALRNLIENALKHSGQDSRITVRVTREPAIEVIDNGIGIPPEQLDTLIQPFQRGESATPGHGLGLSIVNAVARQMGGHLELISPHADGPGLRARLRLRAA